jgi:uncharacterized RDD family membrane protein YckC
MAPHPSPMPAGFPGPVPGSPVPHYGAPGYSAQPQASRPPAADGDPAPRGKRIGAWAIDGGIILVIAAILGASAIENLQSSVATRVAVSVPETIYGLLFSGADVQQAASDVGGTVWRTIVSAVQRTILLIILIEAAYHFVMVAWKGRTVGRLVTDLQVRRRHRERHLNAARRSRWEAFKAVTGPGVFPALARALATAAAASGLYGLAWIILIHGSFGLAFLTWLAAVGLLVANIVTAMFGKRRRSVSDVLAGTVVVRTRNYAKAAEAAERAREAAQASSQVAVQVGRESAERIAQSQTVQQLKDTGARWRDQVKASDSGRRIGKAGQGLATRVKSVYDEKRNARNPDPPR